MKLKKGATINIKDKSYIKAFEKMKILFTPDPILIYPDLSKPLSLTTVARNMAIGAVLSENHKPICYASRTLNKHEINYATIEIQGEFQIVFSAKSIYFIQNSLLLL